MSRSLKHTPVCGVTTARSEHWSKRRWNRVFRRRTQAALVRGLEALPLNIHKETKVWEGEKDGRMRFDPLARLDAGDYYDGAKMMRK